MVIYHFLYEKSEEMVKVYHRFFWMKNYSVLSMLASLLVNKLFLFLYKQFTVKN